MKFIHTGDLHLGKTVNDFSMTEDQREILLQILHAAEEEKAEAVILSGDIYDRAVPPAEAVTLLDGFLTEAARRSLPVLMISGNHDSPERLGFAEEILEKKGIWIAGSYRGSLKKVTFTDEYGTVTFVLMPFVKPSSVGAGNGQEAVKTMLSKEGLLSRDDMSLDRLVLVTHFFVTDAGREPELSDGETAVHVGGLESVEASLFSAFDYVALGHIHRPQRTGERPVYYAGAPLAFSFSEAGQTKYMNVVEIREAGELTVRQLPFRPLHEMRIIRGRLVDLIRPEVVEAADRQDYIKAALTDDDELIDPAAALRSAYPNLMQIILTKNERKEKEIYVSSLPERRKSIPELFTGFYQLIRQEEPDEERRKVIAQAAEEAEEERQ